MSDDRVCHSSYIRTERDDAHILKLSTRVHPVVVAVCVVTAVKTRNSTVAI